MTKADRTLRLCATTETEIDMLEVPKGLDAIDVVFGVRPPLPAWDDIPGEFKCSRNEYARVASSLFFNGGRLSDFGLTIKDELDDGDVMRALRACLGSFDPKHEHKEAGVAYMLSQWCNGKPSA